jgi:predicted NUDIX family NTP pyrophosphohydrolase
MAEGEVVHETSSRRRNASAGLLLFRRTRGPLQLFLAHPGGPFWRKHDEHAWTIPKGLIEVGEEPLAAAQREFQEETGIPPLGPFIPLGSVKQRSGKTVHAWAWEGDADPRSITSNEGRTEWPRGSGHWITYPEVDRCDWFDPVEARHRLIAAQAELIDRLEAMLNPTAAP